MSERNYVKEMEEYVRKNRDANTAFKPLDESDQFTHNGNPQFSVLDFWKYHYSRIDESKVAEFLVAKALGVERAENTVYWTAYDMSYRDKRIEVKETSYVHPWGNKISKTRTFSIEPSRTSYWGDLPVERTSDNKRGRQSEVYVFCLNTYKDPESYDVLNIDFWEFYVVPTFKSNQYAAGYGNPNQKKISLNVVKKMTEPVAYEKLREAVDLSINESDAYYLG